MNKIWLLGITMFVVIAFNSCKPKQSTYRAAYEQAQERTEPSLFDDEFADDDEFGEFEEVEPVSKPRNETTNVETGNTENTGNIGYPDINESLNIATRQERINPYEGESFQSLRRYNVVIGSFRNRTNATALKERMQYEGYNVIMAENELGMIRVIVSSTDNKAESVRSRTTFRSKYYPNFQDAWILEQRYR
ncbi:MAG: SPOR domain-containing protein [Tannerellaceae bacterium]|jgi:cell division protein FtsN|nr:SPOR domain-containing protein [Tannerellaceae bacterium]